ncbi:MAG: hypothetical protein JOZ13_06725 [Alphaproteobacteria bacterium]|nr:hypothetical protein [Alphaproteobacteria bacterium]
MEQGLLWPLVVLAISGITWFAYVHPKEYVWLFWPTVVLLFVGEIVMTFWNAAASQGEMAARYFVPFDKKSAADDALKAVLFPDPFVIWPFVLLATLYLSALFLFGLLPRKERPQGDGENQPKGPAGE